MISSGETNPDERDPAGGGDGRAVRLRGSAVRHSQALTRRGVNKVHCHFIFSRQGNAVR